MKELTQNPEWKPQSGGNETLTYPDFYISYNASPCMGISFFASDDGEETAMKNTKTGTWYILNGDFRETYQQLARKGGF